MSIEFVNAPSDNATNPVEFKFNISYNNTDDVNCIFLINEDPIAESINLNIANVSFIWDDLQDGNHNWSLSCNDLINSEASTEAYINGSFTIHEELSITTEEEIYMLGEEIE